MSARSIEPTPTEPGLVAPPPLPLVWLPARPRPGTHGWEDDLAGLLLGVQGRLSRRTFWWVGVVGLGLAQLYLWALFDIAGTSPSFADGLSSALVLWPVIAVTAKRWHDRDRSAWWVLINLVPVLGTLWTLLQCGLLRGTDGPNRFGADPLVRRREDPLG